MKYKVISWLKSDRGVEWLIEPPNAPERTEMIVTFNDSDLFEDQYKVIQKLVDEQGPNREWRAELLGGQTGWVSIE